MPRSSRHSLRLALFWTAFACATIGAGVAVHALYDTVRRELEDQAGRTLAQEVGKARIRIGEFTDSVRHSTLAELCGFHVDGLTRALRRWDDANAVVVGTFEWDAARGFIHGGTVVPGQPEPEALVALWEEFAVWRAAHPEVTTREPGGDGVFVAHYFRTIENPRLSAASLGYQAENLEMLTYAGRTVDPWAGWACRRGEPGSPWVFWYRPGPDAPVRGCFVDAKPILASLQADLADAQLARLELVPHQEAAASPDTLARDPIGLLLPGYRLAAAPGDLFLEKQSRVRFFTLVVVLLLGVFLLGVILLVLYSRREIRDAERKTSFVSHVSHELRTPLTSIRMFADMLGAPQLPEEKRAKFAATISRESQRLGAMIERLLTFHALEQGKVSVVIGPVDVAALLRETLEEMEGSLREGGLRVECECPSGPVMGSTDRAAVKQALINLLDNSLKYARSGGVVTVTLEPRQGTVRLRVRDRGPGIPAGMHASVFEPFVQGGRTLTDKTPGVGLGLSIARGLMRGAGGDLVLLPDGPGATFEIRVPSQLS